MSEIDKHGPGDKPTRKYEPLEPDQEPMEPEPQTQDPE